MAHDAGKPVRQPSALAKVVERLSIVHAFDDLLATACVPGCACERCNAYARRREALRKEVAELELELERLKGAA